MTAAVAGASSERTAGSSGVPPGVCGDETAAPLAPATARAYARDWAAFRAWCRDRGCAALPASPDDVAAFLAELAGGRRSRGTLDRYLAALGHRHRAEGHAWDTKHPAIRAALRAAPRRMRARQLTPAALGHLSAACGRDLAGLRDCALLLLHLGAGLRRGEVVGLDAEHVRFTAAGLTLVLMRPEGEGEGGEQRQLADCLIVPGADPAVCPVRALQAWLAASACQFGPVFRKVDRWGRVEGERLGVDEVRRILLRRAAQAKLGLRKGQRLHARGTRNAARAGDGQQAPAPRER